MTYKQKQKMQKVLRLTANLKVELIHAEAEFIYDDPILAERMRDLALVMSGVHGLLLNEHKQKTEEKLRDSSRKS